MFKRIFCIILALVMFALGVIPAYAAETQAEETAYFAVTTADLDLYSGDNTVICTIPEGSTVYVSEDAYGISVEYQGTLGYVKEAAWDECFLHHIQHPFWGTNPHGLNLFDDNGNFLDFVPGGSVFLVKGVYLKDTTDLVVEYNGQHGHLYNGGLIEMLGSGGPEYISPEETPQEPVEPEKPPEETQPSEEPQPPEEPTEPQPPEEPEQPEEPTEPQQPEEPEQPETLADFPRTGEEYEAEVIQWVLSFQNTKGVEVAEVPIGAKVHVYGLWTQNPRRAVISWNGEFGTVWACYLKKVEEISYTKQPFEAVTTAQLNIRDDNYDYLGYIPKGERIQLIGISNKYPDRAAVQWGDILGTVALSYLIPCTGEGGYWAVVSKWDLDIWGQDDIDFDDVSAYSLVWVYGIYTKDLNVQRAVVSWYGTIGTVRTDLMKKATDGVFVSIRHQKATLIRDGKLVAQGDCVTGLKGEHDTRVGAFSIKYKAQKVTLSGDDYEVDVDFWMPFDGEIGLHDASYRISFGGSIYEWNGSHGCVNLPHWLAETIYLNSYTGMSVYVAA